MFDIDDTLVNSIEFDGSHYVNAVQSVIDAAIDTDWASYQNVTDSGILNEILDRQGIHTDRNRIHQEVKKRFTRLVQSHLYNKPVKEVLGASAFLQKLRERNDICLAIATGGWEETAKLKLDSAGIDYSGIAFASASDHVSRIGVMKVAESRCLTNEFASRSYFGDAIWDQKATQLLQFNFIQVGDKINHTQQISDFQPSDHIWAMLGLSKAH